MNKATLVVEPFYQNNRIFDLNDQKVNRDNCMYPFFLLKKEFEKADIILATQDINPISESQIIIYNEMPKYLPQGKAIEKSYLLVFESELIRSDNWDLKKHRHFKKIFTWNDDFVDNIKYFKINFSQQIPDLITVKEKTNLCTLIAGNKMKHHSKELYSERLKTIRWFEKLHRDGFDLYGIGWDRLFLNRQLKYFNKYKFIKQMALNKRPSYKGFVQSKNDILSKYKFAICYENVKDIPGYITEKIFDCFFAGCIPIYWGPPNIIDYIPQECFIDRSDFNTHESLYKYIKEMTNDEYNMYLENIGKYLKSKKIVQFSAKYFANSLIEEIFRDVV